VWIYDKLRIWKLRYHEFQFNRWYEKEHAKLLKNHAAQIDFAALQAEEQFTLGEIQDEIDRIRASALAKKAYDFDVELPPLADADMWKYTDDGQHVFLSKKGRAHVRKLIHEEYGRHFDITYGFFTRIVFPGIALLVGVLGAYTGYLAVKQKQPDQKNVPVHQNYFQPSDQDD
jgi:hypothetical protein